MLFCQYVACLMYRTHGLSIAIGIEQAKQTAVYIIHRNICQYMTTFIKYRNSFCFVSCINFLMYWVGGVMLVDNVNVISVHAISHVVAHVDSMTRRRQSYSPEVSTGH